jgi:SAM-dependent methyltransferase
VTRQPNHLDLLRRAAQHWSEASEGGLAQATRWWQHDHIVRHINTSICGRPVSGLAGGDIARITSVCDGARLHRGVSVGCGNGAKELALLQSDVVGHFDLFEISEVRIAQGRSMAHQKGLAGRVSFRQEPIDFSAQPRPSYDLVYWNNALHHMLDVDAAVGWSRQVLAPGGILYVNDFVGPTRMQFPDEMLRIANRVRAALPDRLLRHPSSPDRGPLPRQLDRPDPQRLAARDPTECADSDNILPAIRSHFPASVVTLTGGVVYHLALNDVLANFRTLEDRSLLELLLLLDDICAAAGQTHYAVAVAHLDARRGDAPRRP